MARSAGRLLLVDDNERGRRLMRQSLEEHGYKVTTAGDGHAAIEQVTSGRFDLVLLDIVMPGMDGSEVLREIRRIHEPISLPVIMVTARDQAADVVAALKLGANDYVTKPIDLTVAIARIETQLSLRRAIRSITELQERLHHRNLELETANQRMKRDLDSAARVQRALLPSELPNVPGMEFAWVFKPCEELGGDILNVFRIGESHVGFYVLDVSGHGVPAAMLSVTLSRLLSPWPQQASIVQHVDASGVRTPAPPAEVCAELNRRFPMAEEAEQFFTLLYAVLDLRSKTLRYISAGHPGPTLLHAGEAIDLTKSNLPIGLDASSQFVDHTLQLQDGDRLYAYSDGISEARNSMRELFGAERVSDSIRSSSRRPLSESLATLVGDAAAWINGPFDDDVSALALEVRE
jgi:sigma-B regulation protein RsbU (phosphoserine phosphatase)